MLCPVVGAVPENAHATFFGTLGIALVPRLKSRPLPANLDSPTFTSFTSVLYAK